MNTLKAEKRDMSIKAKRLRREGYVTGNVFGKEIKGSIPIKLEKSAVDRLLKIHRRGSQVMLDVDGESMDVLLKEINFNPLKGQVDEIDFQALVKGEKVQSVAEVILENHDKVASGVLQLLLEEVPYRALPGDLIEKVMVDVGNLKVGDSIKVGDLDMAKNEKVDLLIDPETIIVTVSESRNAVEEDTGEEAEGGEA
ncbi:MULTISPECIES: 50S ribosomal protein L25 [unclassified Blautia]|uniref:50S ribosomal protein L25 n=1 Tax=unclassified Blautia TaxID=2648079 RepID=UPI000B3AB7B6|nr:MULTISPECIES: 50S ribosomal protein L25 [unclassified Blautia]OUN30322.1 50S ribosomal protein L25/general stress protein Ctc [Blautia sp. An81]OUN93015.1 50S ribosomal protein L25/general stress protein Ctc [Blautia sp. An46]HJD36518.1 50S ribosomal protein L25 [Candidatus Blautia ornithocaccae]